MKYSLNKLTGQLTSFETQEIVSPVQGELFYEI
jgi:hypothetical protein